MNNWRILVTAATFQDPIGPCGPLEQLVDSCRHSTMAAWSSALDFGAHPVVEYYYSGYTVGVRLRVLGARGGSFIRSTGSDLGKSYKLVL